MSKANKRKSSVRTRPNHRVTSTNTQAKATVKRSPRTVERILTEIAAKVSELEALVEQIEAPVAKRDEAPVVRDDGDEPEFVGPWKSLIDGPAPKSVPEFKAWLTKAENWLRGLIVSEHGYTQVASDVLCCLAAINGAKVGATELSSRLMPNRKTHLLIYPPDALSRLAEYIRWCDNLGKTTIPDERLRSELTRQEYAILSALWTPMTMSLNELHELVWKDPVADETIVKAVQRLAMRLPDCDVKCLAVNIRNGMVMLSRPK